MKVWNLAFWRSEPPGQAAEGTVMESQEDDADDADDEADVGGPAVTPQDAHGIPVRPGGGQVVATSITGKAVTTTKRPPRTMLAATAATVVLGLSYTVLAGPLAAYTDRSAQELLTRTPYIEEVLRP